eukprot:scaffold384773_cov48-Prasinocladus_malaysianus.AAC.1
MVAEEPSLLLEPQWSAIAAHKQALHEFLPPGANIEKIVEANPRTLIDDVRETINRLERLAPGCDIATIL